MSMMTGNITGSRLPVTAPSRLIICSRFGKTMAATAVRATSATRRPARRRDMRELLLLPLPGAFALCEELWGGRPMENQAEP